MCVLYESRPPVHITCWSIGYERSWGLCGSRHVLLGFEVCEVCWSRCRSHQSFADTSKFDHWWSLLHSLLIYRRTPQNHGVSLLCRCRSTLISHTHARTHAPTNWTSTKTEKSLANFLFTNVKLNLNFKMTHFVRRFEDLLYANWKKGRNVHVNCTYNTNLKSQRPICHGPSLI